MKKIDPAHLPAGVATLPAFKLAWTKKLSSKPLCGANESCTDDYMVNAAAISDDGNRVIGATYYQNYLGTTRKRVDGTYGAYCFKTAGSGTLLFKDEYDGDKGIYAVAISGDGEVAAAGGLFRKGGFGKPKRGLIRAYAVDTGAKLLDVSDLPDRINAVSLSANGSALAAVSETTLYLFTRNPSGSFAVPPQTIDLEGYCESVALHPSGAWVAAADQAGGVYVANIVSGALGTAVKWTAKEPKNPSNPASLKVPVKFHSVTVSAGTDRLAAGGGDFVYLFERSSLAQGPIGRFRSTDANGTHNVRWVAIASDGSFVTTVVNDEDPNGTGRGRLIKLTPSAAKLDKEWERPLRNLPNMTGIDASGTRIVASDGYPDDVPGTFYLFDGHGTKMLEHHTVKMNWPVAVSADGDAVVGGSDDNTLFLFRS